MATQADLYNTEPVAAGAAEVAPPEPELEQPEGVQHRARRQNVVEVVVDGRSDPGRSLPEVPSLESPRNRRRRRNVPGGTENAKLSAKKTVQPRRMATGMTGRKILLGTVLVTVAVVVTLLVMLVTLDATWIW